MEKASTVCTKEEETAGMRKVGERGEDLLSPGVVHPCRDIERATKREGQGAGRFFFIPEVQVGKAMKEKATEKERRV